MRKEDIATKHRDKFVGIGVRTLRFDKERNLIATFGDKSSFVTEYCIIVGDKYIFKGDDTFSTNCGVTTFDNWLIQINHKHQILVEIDGEKHVICKEEHVEADELILVYYCMPNGVEFYLCDGAKIPSYSNFIMSGENMNSLLIVARILSKFYLNALSNNGHSKFEIERPKAPAMTSKMEKAVAEYEKNQLVREQRDQFQIVNED